MSVPTFSQREPIPSIGHDRVDGGPMTQLIGPNVDDAASAVTSIGFDFAFPGTVYQQFSVNSTGSCVWATFRCRPATTFPASARPDRC